jgi:hypothetical protein
MRRAWVTAKLGDLCSIQLGGTPARKMPIYWDPKKTTDNVWLSISDMPKSIGEHIIDSKEYISDAGAKKIKLAKKGTLLLSFKLSIGRICFAGRDLRTNEAIAALEPVRKEAERKQCVMTPWLYHQSGVAPCGPLPLVPSIAALAAATQPT